MKHTLKNTFWYGFNITALALIAGFIVLTPFVYGFEQLSKTVDVYLTPTVNTATADSFVFTVDITNASSTPLNAAEFELIFNPKEISLIKIVPERTLCEDQFLITNTVDNQSGTALFQCGTLAPFTAATGTIATVYAHILTTNTVNIRFGTTTHILAHDGYGTDVTRSTQTALISSF